MQRIPLENWSRRKHFETFNAYEQPHFAMCANIEVAPFLPWIKDQRTTYTIGVVYLIAHMANAIPEFRQRTREGGVIEHDIVHPSTTIMAENQLFTFCTIHYERDFPAYAARAAEKIARMKVNPSLEEESDEDDLLFMTAIPWVSFTSFMHPLPSWPPDSVPRFAWGKRFEEGGRVLMPLAVQAHHALMDGLHVAMFYEGIQELFANPALI